MEIVPGIIYDRHADVLEIDGVRFSRVCLRYMAKPENIGKIYKLVDVQSTVTVKDLSDREAAIEAFLKEGQSAVRTLNSFDDVGLINQSERLEKASQKLKELL